MKKFGKQGEAVNGTEAQASAIGRNVEIVEEAQARGQYVCTCTGPIESRRKEYCHLRDHIADLEAQGLTDTEVWRKAVEAFHSIPTEVKWVDGIKNLVVTVGKNDALDKYLAGSAYTAAWYMGLISSTGYTTGAAAGDTMASHGGWAEDQNYSAGTRPAPSFSAASGGSKTTSSAVAYSINASTTIKGCFLVTNSTKGGTTGILYSAGLFTGGDKPVGNGDTLNVTYTASL